MLIEPWKHKDTHWKTEAEYLNWIRSGLRKIWARHPIKGVVKNKGRKKKDNGKGRAVYHNKCNACGKWYQLKYLQVDHIKPNPSLKKIDDLGEFTKSLLHIDESRLQLLCTNCHGIKTYAERYDVTWNQAAKRKSEIRSKKK